MLSSMFILLSTVRSLWPTFTYASTTLLSNGHKKEHLVTNLLLVDEVFQYNNLRTLNLQIPLPAKKKLCSADVTVFTIYTCLEKPPGSIVTMKRSTRQFFVMMKS